MGKLKWIQWRYWARSLARFGSFKFGTRKFGENWEDSEEV
jgi:hypothetical protein